MGKLFVIDGTDGSGKQTQFDLLKKHLDEDGINYKTVSFPNYDSPSSSLVKMYLSGEFGENANDVSPYIASTFYAADRYTTANMVHQAGNISDKKEREKFLNWLFDLEFNLYGLPKPTRVFFLNMPPQKVKELIKDRKNKFTHNNQKDIHERDEKHLQDAYDAACSLVDIYDWKEIKCVKNNELRTRENIHEEIYKIVFDEIQKN